MSKADFKLRLVLKEVGQRAHQKRFCFSSIGSCILILDWCVHVAKASISTSVNLFG